MAESFEDKMDMHEAYGAAVGEFIAAVCEAVKEAPAETGKKSWLGEDESLRPEPAAKPAVRSYKAEEALRRAMRWAEKINATET